MALDLSNPLVLASIINSGSNIAGGLISGYGAGKINEQNSLQNQQNSLQDAELQRRQQLLDYFLGQRQQGYQRDVQGLNAASMDPLAVQRSRRNFALMGAILPELRNVSVNVPRGLQGYNGSISGGFRIPEGGFSPATLKYASPEAGAAAEGQFYSAASPFMNPPDLSRVGYGQAGVQPTIGAQLARSAFQDQQAKQNADILAKINQPLPIETQAAQETNQQGQKKKKTSWWKKLLGAALPIGASLIPGVGPVVGGLLGAGAGAAGSAVSGGNPLMGAITGGVGGVMHPFGTIGGGSGASLPSGAVPGLPQLSGPLPQATFPGQPFRVGG